MDVVNILLTADAVELAFRQQQQEQQRLQKLNKQLRHGLLTLLPGKCQMLSPPEAAASILCFAIPGYEAAIVCRLLAEKFAILLSSGTACSAESRQTSPVLAAMGIAPDLARAALRVSFGYNSAVDDIQALLTALPQILKEY